MKAAPIDQETRSTLDLIAADPIHEDDRGKVTRAIVECALAREDRLADPNEWRPKLLDAHGVNTVHPAVIGATVTALKAAGVLVWEDRPDRWVITTGSTSRNNGKPARVYRLAHIPEEVAPAIVHTSLKTVEVSMPGEGYTLLTTGPRLTVHLAGPSATGGTGPCICGFDRFARGEDGRMLHGFSIGGGVYGPGVTHEVCAECASLAGSAQISGLHRGLFPQEVAR